MFVPSVTVFAMLGMLSPASRGMFVHSYKLMLMTKFKAINFR